MSEPIFVERWVTFVLVDGKWSFQIWADHEPVAGKVYKLKIQVPPELAGEVVSELNKVEKQSRQKEEKKL